MKKIIFSIIVILLVFLIYYFNITNDIFYLSLGDYLSYGINNLKKTDIGYSDIIKDKINAKTYVNYSTIEDYRVNDLINDIIYNKVIYYNDKEYRLQNLLIKSNFITLSIGMNDLLYKDDITYEYIDELLIDIDKLFSIIKTYNKEEVYFLGFYNIINNNEIINYTNNKVNILCEKYNINYIDISKLEYYIIKGKYPNNNGYLYIAEQLLTLQKNKL